MLCPRYCGADRDKGEKGYCGMGALPVIARAAAHFGEEPCLSGTKGSGAVFFSGCNMKCVFCQNRDISFEGHGLEVTVDRLAEILLELQDKGVHNINLVTGTHFTDKICKALKIAKLDIPVVWNSGGYDSIESLKMLEGLIDIYMPDFKYTSPKYAKLYSGAEDYRDVAIKAIKEMYRQVGGVQFDDNEMLTKGIIIRHLVLPQRLDDCFDVIDWVQDTFPEGDVIFSLMSQYTPLNDLSSYPEITRPITLEEQMRAQSYFELSNIELGYTQELAASGNELIPDFDGTGVL